MIQIRKESDPSEGDCEVGSGRRQWKAELGSRTGSKAAKGYFIEAIGHWRRVKENNKILILSR